MARKYLNRAKNEEFDQDYDEDSGAKKKLEVIGPKIDDVDPFDVQYRKIAIEKDITTIPTNEEKVKEEIRQAGHQTRTTNQFQKIVNAHLEERVSKINKIKNAKQQFDEDIKRLTEESNQSISELANTRTEELSSKAMGEMLQSLELNRDITVSKLEHFKNRVRETEEEVLQQEINIEKIRKEIQRKKVKEQQMQEDAHVIKNELTNLKNKYDMAELKKALDILMKSENYKE